ncbi:MAG: MFS transporter [Lachnospiraceae bacterium]|nr:MFS transporter [Lachnospiraceae bacterium]
MKNPKMNWGRAVLVSLPFFALMLFWQAYDYVIPLVLSGHYHLSTTLYSVIMSADNVIALIFLPLFGALSDRITGRLGRRTPLILSGTLGGIAGLFLMNLEDEKAVAGNVRFLPFLIFLIITVFFMSLNRAPAATVVTDCFIRPQRTKANAVLNLMGGIAGVLFGVFGHLLIKEVNGISHFSRCILFVASGMFTALTVYFFAVREVRFVKHVQDLNESLGLIDEKTDTASKEPVRLKRDELRSLFCILGSVLFIYMGYNGFHTHYSNFLTRHLLKSASWTGPYLLEVGMGMLMMIPAAFITTALGRKKSSLLGMLCCVAGYFGASTVTPEKPELLYLWFFIAAAGYPLFAINLGPMVLELGQDNESGRFMGYYYAAVTIAQIFTPTLASIFINRFDYGIIGFYGAVFTSLAFLVMLPVTHGDVKPDFLKALEDSTS